ncbi:unnamed protein product [Medioppia subpectinata]|uniref:Solute carrier family 12 member 9 n=1 Tax=Medioppia subpectinata TaxID=1979941 RepID=A0A7R9KZ68_9ACAR|nr:unnamed protein product [Medioppia subpectinata]CAG2112238.1 unnamed protein product [Medioppia subpectinata]
MNLVSQTVDEMKAYTTDQMSGRNNPAFHDDSEDIIVEDLPPAFPKYKRSIVLPSFLKGLGLNKSNEISLIEQSSEIPPQSPKEVAPKMDFYVNEMIKERRPDIEDIHLPRELRSKFKKKGEDIEDNNESESNPSSKFGWIDGVYIRTMMNLFGVMLFLRMGWMAGQAGVILALVQILVATIITVITTTSMIALCTNGDIGGGGIYSMISRTVGHEAGGVIGFLFTFTNAAFVGLNVLGTAESITDILNVFGKGICEVPSGLNDMRILGFICLILTAAIPLISLQFEAKTMMFFFLTLVISLTDYFVGALIPPTEKQQGMGVAYWHKYVIVPNLLPVWEGATFFNVFSVFFPSVTGIFTGASMSADLKEPASAITKGTFLAIGTTSTTYALIVIFLGFTVVRYADGDPSQIIFNNQTCTAPNGCEFGLINDYQTMAKSGALYHTGIAVDPLIYAGIFAATLSSALGCYMAAPRIFQAFCDDHLVPVIGWFGKGYGPARDPRHGYIVTFIIGGIFVAIGSVDTASTWISNFYLGAFFMVNFALFHVSLVNPISFRPSFKFYNKWISLIIGLFCICLMYLFDPISASVVIGLTIIIYLLMLFVDPAKANWGTANDACCFDCARSITYRLNVQEHHIKNYRPIILALSGNPKNRQVLVDMADRMTKKHGMLFLSHITEGPLSYKTRERVIDGQKAWIKSEKINAFYKLTRERVIDGQKAWIKSEKINAFYKLVESDSLSDGLRSQLHSTGVGKFAPNIVMIGYKSNWKTCKEDDLRDYYDTIHNVLESHYSLIILRVKEGIDFSDYFVAAFNNYVTVNDTENVLNASDIYSLSRDIDAQTAGNNTRTSLTHIECQQLSNRFKYKQRPGFVDVWWLSDDGGLTLLIPYILKNEKLWRKCKLRVFSVTDGTEDTNQLKDDLCELLNKFRIPFADVYALSYENVDPSVETKAKFDSILENSMTNELMPIIKTSAKELISFKEQTIKTLKLREMLVKYSKTSTMIALTLPIPRKYKCSATLYMCWLEVLTYDMPPLLMIRGNHESVLTFYC